MVGSGARGMVGVAFGVKPGDSRFEELRDAFLAHYEAGLLDTTHRFEGIDALLQDLERAGTPWGIVTNKATRFTRPLVAGLRPRAAGGRGRLRRRRRRASKPHPEPAAGCRARAEASRPESVAYVGDDLRDAQAAQAAGMPMIAATWGYLGLGEPVEAWGADALVREPADVADWLALQAS